jgi:hypothetical protein
MVRSLQPLHMEREVLISADIMAGIYHQWRHMPSFYNAQRDHTQATRVVIYPRGKFYAKHRRLSRTAIGRIF